MKKIIILLGCVLFCVSVTFGQNTEKREQRKNMTVKTWKTPVKGTKYLDHVTKPAFFLLLGLHWFNPVIWLVWGLMSRDMEIACDEDVICKKEKTYKYL